MQLQNYYQHVHQKNCIYHPAISQNPKQAINYLADCNDWCNLSQHITTTEEKYDTAPDPTPSPSLPKRHSKLITCAARVNIKYDQTGQLLKMYPLFQSQSLSSNPPPPQHNNNNNNQEALNGKNKSFHLLLKTLYVQDRCVIYEYFNDQLCVFSRPVNSGTPNFLLLPGGIVGVLYIDWLEDCLYCRILDWTLKSLILSVWFDGQDKDSFLDQDKVVMANTRQ